MAEITSTNIYAKATETAEFLKSRLPENLKNPTLAIICGSGLGGLADTVQKESSYTISYSEVPNFHRTSGKSMSMKLVIEYTGLEIH